MMLGTPYSPAAARRVFLTLTGTRWFPVGLVVGIITLVPLERGLSVAATLAALALTGWVVFALELPMAGFADSFGRRPIYLVAAVVNVIAAVVFLLADSFWTFALAAALTGVFRALDSGPLEAWFVDTVHATTPGADVDGPLASHSTVLGVCVAVGALLSGALVWWHPVEFRSALFLPLAVFVTLNVLHLVASAVLLREARLTTDASAGRRAWQSVRAVPIVIRDGIGLLGSNRVLRGLVFVGVFWALAMVVFETFQPIRLAELVGGEERAGAVMGPVAAAGWAVFALGATGAGLLSRQLGPVRTAILARILNGLGAVVMGLVVGPVALVAAYLLTYGLHGSGGPVHRALLHREAHSGNRATVLSIDSMMMFGAYSLATPLLGLFADHTSTQAAMVLAGALSLLGALCYRPALRRERKT